MKAESPLEFYRANGNLVTATEIVLAGVTYPARDIYWIGVSRRDPRLIEQLGAFTILLVLVQTLSQLFRTPGTTLVVLLGFGALFAVHSLQRSSRHRWLYLHARDDRVLATPALPVGEAEQVANAIRAMLAGRASQVAGELAT